jgi:hypothetical protein
MVIGWSEWQSLAVMRDLPRKFYARKFYARKFYARKFIFPSDARCCSINPCMHLHLRNSGTSKSAS